MSDVELTEAEVKALEDGSWNGGRAGWLAAVTDIKAAARAEGAREALREAADAMTVPDHDCFKMMCPHCAVKREVASRKKWLGDLADDRPGGCIHGPGARPGVCPNCGTIVSEDTP